MSLAGVYHVKPEQFDELKRIAGLTDAELNGYRNIRDVLKQTYPSDKVQLQHALMDLDRYLEEVSDIVQFLDLLRKTKEKEMNDLLLPEWEKSKLVAGLARVKLDLESSTFSSPDKRDMGFKYKTLKEDVSALESWIQYYQTLHWVLKSRVENLRLVWGVSY